MTAYSLYHRIVARIRLPFRKEKEFFSLLYSVLGFYPRSAAPYRQALLHKSMHRKEQGHQIDNERLEFLGDAILDAVMGDVVFRRFPGKREGFLTNVRSKVVQRESLNRLSHEIGLDRLLQTQSLNQSHNSNLAGNALEALVGAIYLDYGYATCHAFVRQRILRRCINIEKVAYQEVNFKSKLLEWSQKRRVDVEFRLVSQRSDEHHNPIFTTRVMLNGIATESGKGYSKKESQQQAAKKTCQRLSRDRNLVEQVMSRHGNNNPSTATGNDANMPTQGDRQRKKRDDAS